MLHTALLVGAGLASGWVDSIAGGGGLISLPALLLTGMPTLDALATNKIAATFGSSTAAIRYGRAGLVARVAWPLAACALVASAAGTLLARHLPATALNTVVAVALVIVALYFSLRRDFGAAERPWPHGRWRYLAVGTAFAVAIGFYDGLVGPGTGSFLTMCFMALLGMGLLRATGSTKLLNCASNLAAAAIFACTGAVHWGDALVMGPSILVGAYLGSGMATRVGPRLIRPVFVGVVLIVGVKKLVWG